MCYLYIVTVFNNLVIYILVCVRGKIYIAFAYDAH